MGPDRLGDLVSDRPGRIEADRRVLEDHRHFGAAHASQFVFRQPDHAAPIEPDAAGQKRILWQQAHHRIGKRALAAATFADDAEDLAALDLN